MIKSMMQTTSQILTLLFPACSYSYIIRKCFGLKSIMFTFFGFRLLLFAETSSPALENNLSAGTDVPGIQRYFLASSCNSGR